MSSIDKSKSPILEQKMNKENNIGIDDPALIEFYKSLNEVQQGIVKKLPEQGKIEFLTFARQAKEKEAEKLAKMTSQEKEMYFKQKEEAKKKRREPIKLKKKTSSPLEEFLEDKKFSPIDKKLILSEWEFEVYKELQDLYNKPYSPPEWLKEDLNPEKMDKKKITKKR